MNSKYLLIEGENKRLYYYNAHLIQPLMTVNIHNQKYFFPLATTIYKESLSIILYSSSLLNRNTLFLQVRMWAEETCQIRKVPGWSYFKSYFLFFFIWPSFTTRTKIIISTKACFFLRMPTIPLKMSNITYLLKLKLSSCHHLDPSVHFSSWAVKQWWKQ